MSASSTADILLTSSISSAETQLIPTIAKMNINEIITILDLIINSYF